MSDAAQEIARRDEILQLLFWLEGEGFGGAATLQELSRFLTYPESEVEATLTTLLRHGAVVLAGEIGEYRLTEAGQREASRRFADEFAPLLAQGHGECNDPDCECHSDPKAAAECHAGRRPAPSDG